MTKLILDHILSDYASRAKFNSNFDAIEDAIENTLGRDGTSPNSMEADFDMNSHRILNLPAPISANEPARLADIASGAVLTTLSLVYATVDTISALRAYTMSSGLVGQLIYVRGHTSIGDGGEGFFRVQTTLVTEDFGVKIVSSTSGYYFIRQFKGCYQAKWFGVLSDGSADTIANIKKAQIAAYNARLSGGLRAGLEFDPGTYKISSTFYTLPTLHQFCRVPFGVQLVPTASMAYGISSATLSGTTFTQNLATASTFNCGQTGLENIYVNALAATCTITSKVVYLGGCGEGLFRGLYVGTDQAVDGIWMEYSPNAQLFNPRFDQYRVTAAGTGLTLTSQSNAVKIDQWESNGKWINAINVGGSRVVVCDGDCEGNPTNGVYVAAPNCTVRENYFENMTSCITLGDLGNVTASSPCVTNNTYAGTIATAVVISSATSFTIDETNQVLPGSTVTHMFSGSASTAENNGVIRIIADPDTFTTADINLASKGAIVVEVFGSNASGDNHRYAMFSTETNRRLTDIHDIIHVAALPSNAAIGVTVMVDDANSTTYRSIVAAGGANLVKVYWDGTNWRIG